MCHDANSNYSSTSSRSANSPNCANFPNCRYVVLKQGQDKATEDQIKDGGNESADLGTFHFIFPEDQRVKPFRAEGYNIRITNQSENAIRLVSRRLEIQTVVMWRLDVVQGPGVTGRQPILKLGESFEYTSIAPLTVKPKLDKTSVVARMSGEYDFVVLSDDGTTPLSSTPLHAKLGVFHFILPALSSTWRSQKSKLQRFQNRHISSTENYNL